MTLAAWTSLLGSCKKGPAWLCVRAPVALGLTTLLGAVKSLSIFDSFLFS